MSVKDFKPTRLEMELIEHLWRMGHASIREIQESMPEDRRLEYTTVQMTIYRLEQKGAVRRVKKIGNAHIFEPLVTRKATMATLIESFLSTFGGAHEPFVAHLVESGRISSGELKELEKLASARNRSSWEIQSAMTAAIISHLWQSTIAGVAVLAVLAACQNISAGTRRIIGWIGLAKFAVPAAAIAALFSGLDVFPASWSNSPRLVFPLRVPAALLAAAPSLSGNAALPSPASAPLPIAPILAMIWLAVAALLFGSWLVRGMRLRAHILTHCRKDTGMVLADRLAEAAAKAGLRTPPICLVAAEAHGLGALGIFFPVVILPETLEETLNPPELESVLIHEFVHLKRRDNFWSALQTLLVCLFWFDPVVWFLSREISVDTEKSCDERVLGITADPESYADGILKALRLSLGLAQPAFAEAAAMPVVSRVNRILALKGRAERPITRAAALAVACGLFALSGFAGSLVLKAADTRGGGSPALDNGEQGRDANPAIAQPVEMTMTGPAEPGEGPFSLGDLDRQPTALVRTPPDYPPTMRRLGASGNVVLEFVVDATGLVRELRVVSSTRPEFETAALNAVAAWKFRPGMKAGRAVATRMQVTVPFVTAPVGDFPNYGRVGR